MSNQEIPLGSFIEIELQFSDGGPDDTLFLKARVVRVEELPSGHYDIGISFNNVTDKDQVFIDRYIMVKSRDLRASHKQEGENT